MRVYHILVLFMFLMSLAVKNGLSQDDVKDTDTTKYKIGLRIKPRFNTVQVDGCTFFVTSAAAASVTFSINNISTTKWENIRIGPRAGL